MTLDSKKDMSASINWPPRYAAKANSYALCPHTSDATVQEDLKYKVKNVYILLKLIMLFASTRCKDIFLRKEYESGAINV